MVSQMNKPEKSTVTGVVALGFLGCLFFLSLATPDLYYDIVYAGIVISSALTFYYWRKERKAEPNTSPIGMWVVLVVFLLFILLCVILPAL